jgi:[calcium/calmodulin-dependent protein kinase] kinase
MKTNEFQEHPWVTKNGTDPLLSEAENTVDLVVPTDAEMNHAITSTMTNLMTVVCLSKMCS